MGKKYLETKNNTLESSILDVWKDAAKLNEYKTKLGERKRVAGGDGRRTENKKLKGVEVTEGSKEEYEKFFNAAMKKFKINSPADLKSDEEKKKFFDYVDKNYTGEKKEGLEDSSNPANSQHLCAKNVVHEEWGEGHPVHGMHAMPDADGDIAWYDVMFEHGIEKGVSINELKVQASEMHHNHGGKKKKNEGAMKRGKDMDTFKPKPKKEEVELDEKPADFIRLTFNSPADVKKAKKWMDQNLPGANQGFTGVDYSGKDIEFEDVDDAEDLMSKLKKAGFKFKVDFREGFQKQHEFKMQSMKDAVQRVWEMSDREKIENKREKSVKAEPGKTMTGDDMSVIKINPQIKG
jgi:hypothetical protein